ncbi:hypothetical protein ACQKWADRAFT_304544 [Trichoderma austrokoningii]
MADAPPPPTRKEKFRQAGLVVLQALRIPTVGTLLLAAAACWIIIIHIPMKPPYFVFEYFTLFFVSALCCFLAISELAFRTFIKNYFKRTWPVLSEDHGHSWLGIGMIIIGSNLLAMFNWDLKIPSVLNSLVYAAGILSFVFGFLNFVVSFIWWSRKEGITSRQVRARGPYAKPTKGRSDLESGGKRGRSQSRSLPPFQPRLNPRSRSLSGSRSRSRSSSVASRRS